jgi:hypothetical protein
LRAALDWCCRKTEAGLKTRDRADRRMRKREDPRRHLGSVLAVIALCLQLIAPGLHSSLLLGSRTGNGDLSGLLGEHALCLGATSGPSTGEPASPAQPPKDHHHDLASCCFWHGNASQLAPSTAAGLAVSFDIPGIAFPATTYTVVVPAHPSGTFAARAPPVVRKAVIA